MFEWQLTALNFSLFCLFIHFVSVHTDDSLIGYELERFSVLGCFRFGGLSMNGRSTKTSAKIKIIS